MSDRRAQFAIETRIRRSSVGLTITALIALAVLTILNGTGSPGSASIASDSPDLPGTSAATRGPDPTVAATAPPLAYTCGGAYAFDPALFDQPPIDLRSHPAGAVLARFLESGTGLEPGILPDRGWRLAGEDDSTATFIAPVPGGDPPYADAHLENPGNAWRVVGWGQCRPTLSITGVNSASWVLARGEKLDAATTTFVASVTEHTCTGGSSSEGRIREPLILYEPDRVGVIFTVDPLPGGAYTCPGNPATRVQVELSEPLGDRELLDAGQFPWRDATAREPWEG